MMRKKYIRVQRFYDVVIGYDSVGCSLGPPYYKIRAYFTRPDAIREMPVYGRINLLTGFTNRHHRGVFLGKTTFREEVLTNRILDRLCGSSG